MNEQNSSILNEFYRLAKAVTDATLEAPKLVIERLSDLIEDEEED